MNGNFGGNDEIVSHALTTVSSRPARQFLSGFHTPSHHHCRQCIAKQMKCLRRRTFQPDLRKQRVNNIKRVKNRSQHDVLRSMKTASNKLGLAFDKKKLVQMLFHGMSQPTHVDDSMSDQFNHSFWCI